MNHKEAKEQFYEAEFDKIGSKIEKFCGKRVRWMFDKLVKK